MLVKSFSLIMFPGACEGFLPSFQAVGLSADFVCVQKRVNSWPAIDRQPGHRRGDREEVGRNIP